MLKIRYTLVFLLVLLAAMSAFGQGYPLPGPATGSDVLCTDCKGTNAYGEPNAGKKTALYSMPIKAFAGRYLDSTLTRDFQHNGYNFRTARAGKVLVAPSRNRLYAKIGAALVSYSLDTFFTQKLPGGLVPVTRFNAGIYRPETPEDIVLWEQYVYPEAVGSGWRLYGVDSQERLRDFDFDDRGYLYAAYSVLGWGIVKDELKTTTSQMALVKSVTPEMCAATNKNACTQMVDDDLVTAYRMGFTPEKIFSLKVGAKYYVAVGNGQVKTAVYDVTNPAAPSQPTKFFDAAHGFVSWAKDEVGGNIGIVDGAGSVRIYTNSGYVGGSGAVAVFNPSAGAHQFISIAFDGQNFWGAETSTNGTANQNSLWKFSYSGGTWSATPYNVYGGNYSPAIMQYGGDGYLAMSGLEDPWNQGKDGVPSLSLYANDLKLFKISGGTPQPIDLHKFVHKYYQQPFPGYARPDNYVADQWGTLPVKVGNRLFLVYACHGIGDVFEIQAGDAITASKGAAYGTANPSTPAGSPVGPFPGDPIIFGSTTTSTFPLNVQWNFGNPEATDNSTLVQTGQNVIHQYSGLTTAGAITAPKVVKVVNNNDSTMIDQLTVNLSVPTPRIKAGNTLITTNAAQALVLGDTFRDASDGSIESHYGAWTIDNTTTNALPTTAVGAGDCGAHTLSFAANYGAYNTSTFAAVNGAPFSTGISNLSYSVRPFTVGIVVPQGAGTSITFSADPRLSGTAFTPAASTATWTVTWTLKTSGGQDIVAPVTTTPLIGTIPNFPVANRNAITAGSVLTLTVTVPNATTNLVGACQQFDTMTQTVTFNPADPQIGIQTGCANAGSPCSIPAVSLSGGSMADWAFAWTLKNSAGTTVATGSTNPFTPSVNVPGDYSVNLSVTKGIFTTPAQAKNISVAGVVCGPPPSASHIAIASTCTTNCTANQTITFTASPFQYLIQDCDSFSWNFGDGNTATGQQVQHAYSGTGPYTVTLTVSNTSGQPATSVTQQISFGVIVPPPPTCVAPTPVTFTFSGTLGCGPTKACVTGETITFIPSKQNGANFQTCDTYQWSFGDSTSANGVVFPQKSYTNAGAYTVTFTSGNTAGTQQSYSQQLTINAGNGCGPLPNGRNLSFTVAGPGGCSNSCSVGDTLSFTPSPFGYQIQSCDSFSWDFGDGSQGSGQQASHTFAGVGPYNVTMKVTNLNGTVEISRTISLVGNPTLPLPNLGIQGPNVAQINVPVSFVASSDQAQTTHWTWDFGDNQSDNSHFSDTGTTTSIQHTYTAAGTYTVTIRASNTAAGNVNQATRQVTVTSIPTTKFLLPVVIHGGGAGSSVWRTDVQVYNPDAAVNSTNPLRMTVEFKGQTRTIDVTTSTVFFEDFMRFFTTGNDQGPMLVSVTTAKPPQLWTRTYNVSDQGTFGQFIPAIILSGNSTSSSVNASADTEQRLYIGGVRNSDRYRTNLGFVNASLQPITLTIQVYPDRGPRVGEFTRTINPFILDQVSLTSALVPNLPTDKPFSVRVKAPAGSGFFVAYASFIDGNSNDPTYLQAVPETDLTSNDFQHQIVPGVGHINAWRSDVTLLNPAADYVSFDLTYFDQSGARVAEAKNIVLAPSEFLQLDDLLKAGYLAPGPGDGFGTLRIDMSTTADHYPLAFSRTYFDKGVLGSYGQGIPAFAAARANVKVNQPALIPAVRSDANFYTNIGLVNLSNQATSVRVTLLDQTTGAEVNSFQFDMAPNQSIIRSPVNGVDLLRALSPNSDKGTFKVEIISGGPVWAFASCIDKRTSDPEYIAATPLPAQ